MSGSHAYSEMHKQGELARRAKEAAAHLAHCDLCPRHCGADRASGQFGVCRIGDRAVVSSYGPHFGEESVLVGSGGSGTVFFAGCNLLCSFCQNADISHGLEGMPVDSAGLAEIFLFIQRRGCSNLNLVTPTHVVPMWLEALDTACKKGFDLPLVYNCGGYESVKTLTLLDGVVDIYMPDFKFADTAVAEEFCQASDYPERAKEAFAEMHRQVGDLVTDDRGLAVSGLLVRHLVMPEGLAGTSEVMSFLAEKISRDTYVNIMDQYRPCHMAYRHPKAKRRPTGQEIQEAIQAAADAGIYRLDEKPRSFVLRKKWFDE